MVRKNFSANQVFFNAEKKGGKKKKQKNSERLKFSYCYDVTRCVVFKEKELSAKETEEIKAKRKKKHLQGELRHK